VIVGVLLAAGGGSRYTGTTHKLLAPLEVAGERRPVYLHALQHLLDANIDAGAGHAIVVTGAVPLELPPGVIEIPSARWAEGQATSLQAALAAAAEIGADAVVVGLADQPFIPASAWRAVAGASHEPDHPIVVATYDGVRGPNPVRLDRAVWPLLPTEGDEGARSLLRTHPHWIREVQCVGSVADIDTVEDLDRWTSS
jgi:CTP:molybdopterin cytidylyltransferase MocA